MNYPHVMSERDTLAAAHAGISIARYGDGELKLCTGGAAISQRHEPKLQQELCAILSNPHSNVLPCIPNVRSETPRHVFWGEFTHRRYTDLYRPTVRYGSSFITRPDNAPWIDRPDYWAEVSRLWQGKSVCYVGGQDVLLRVIKASAGAVDVIRPPKRDAYSEIDSLTASLLVRPYGVTIIALGAAGTVLASRVAGAQHTLDLGHMGMFMENPGAFSIKEDELTSPTYRRLLRTQHARTNWGKGGYGWADQVLEFAKKIGAEQALDYGCGQATLSKALAERGFKCANYDPGREEYSLVPKLADLVISTDCFEHIEPECVAAVLKHTFCLARKGAFFAIAKQPAKAILTDGRNAHLVCQPTEWWIERLVEAGWARDKIKVKEDAWKKCVLTLTK